MIDLENVAKEAREFAETNSLRWDQTEELYQSIIDVIYVLEAEDDKNGTNRLEQLLERHDVAWIAKEYGLV